jgi:gluconate 5-dehydrogenase
VDKLFDLTGKVVIVTGGGRGIGKTIAEAFAEAGAKIVITGRREEWLNQALEEFKGKGFDCLSAVADVTKQNQVDYTTAATLDRFGRIDVLVNNAGVTWGQPTESMPLEKWQQVIDVNLTGLFLMSQCVGKVMLEQKSGRIINIASVAGLGTVGPSIASTIAYNTSKAGIIAFTKSLAQEWGRWGILVNAIAPGWFPTRMSSTLIERNREEFEARTALGRIGELEELKGTAIFLASEASRFITGQTIVVDGGISI